MQKKRKTDYQKKIGSRNKMRYIKGLLPRFISYVRIKFIVWLARMRGPKIGEFVTIPFKLAFNTLLNKKLINKY